jgi:hypothetical protein
LAHACRRRTRTRLLSLRRCLRGCAAYSRIRRNRVNQSMPTVPVICQGLGYLPLPAYDSRNSHRFRFNLSGWKAIDLAPLPTTDWSDGCSRGMERIGLR